MKELSIFRKKSLENVWWFQKLFVTLHRKNEVINILNREK